MKFEHFLNSLTLEEKQAWWRLLHTTYVVNKSKNALYGSKD